VYISIYKYQTLAALASKRQSGLATNSFGPVSDIPYDSLEVLPEAAPVTSATPLKMDIMLSLKSTGSYSMPLHSIQRMN
jgi:hypothetical protein